jgi:hypothetical protein
MRISHRTGFQKKIKSGLRDYGFVRPDITQEHYVLGGSSLPEVVRVTDGDWSSYLPVYEPQYNSYFDTHGCTVWGGENQIEIYLKQLTENEYNFSERFIYILAKILPPGADPHVVYETIRQYGLIDNSLLPMVDTFKDFLKPNPMTAPFLKKAQEFLEDWVYKHEWLWGEGRVLTPKQKIKIIKEQLKYSPIAVSVTAWFKNGEVFVDKGMRNTHWCVCFKVDDAGRPHIFDSYDQSIKILSSSHNIEFAKKIYMERRTITKGRLTLLLERLYKALQDYGFA